MATFVNICITPVPAEKGRYHVLSSERNVKHKNFGVFYLVDLNEFEHGFCGCMDFEIRSGLFNNSVRPCNSISNSVVNLLSMATQLLNALFGYPIPFRAAMMINVVQVLRCF